jgi:hypothetical protein
VTASKEPPARDDPATLLVWPLSSRAPVAERTNARVPGLRSSGRWLVRTATSTYLIDLDAAVVSRFPGRATSDEVRVAALRRDGEAITLGGVVAVVGHPMRLVLALESDRVTLRTTTTTLAIEPAPLAPGSPEGLDACRAHDPETELA